MIWWAFAVILVFYYIKGCLILASSHNEVPVLIGGVILVIFWLVCFLPAWILKYPELDRTDRAFLNPFKWSL